MNKLIVASNNQHKIEEIKAILSKFDLEILSLKEAEIDIDVEENGVTFIENALIKARTIKELYPEFMVLADDSGLMVDALNGEPGVYSARYSGEHGNDKANNNKLLKEISSIKKGDRKARFVSAIALIMDGNITIEVEGYVHGIIIDEEIGQNGFGYDPLFFIPDKNKTFAQMTSDEKNSISHRANALKLLEEKLKKYL
ncbi:XTP/dITP diphosphatase [Clostridium sp. DL1XJH146]